MAHLREEVAFEGYAQKQPLIVYKERAYDRFVELIQEIEFKVVRALVGAKEILQIAQREIAESAMVVTHELPKDPEIEIPAPAVFSSRADQNEAGIRVIRVNDSASPETPENGLAPIDPKLLK